MGDGVYVLLSALPQTHLSFLKLGVILGQAQRGSFQGDGGYGALNCGFAVQPRLPPYPPGHPIISDTWCSLRPVMHPQKPPQEEARPDQL